MENLTDVRTGWRVAFAAALSLALMLTTATARAQQKDPFDAGATDQKDDAAPNGEGKPAAKTKSIDAKEPRHAAAKKAAAKSGGKRAADKQKPAGVESGTLTGESPAVLAMLESNPKTPAELIRAIDILVDLHRAELAVPFASKLSESKLSPDAAVQLADVVNSAVLMKLAGTKQLGPEATKFFDAVLTAAERARRDPIRLAGFVNQLADPSDVVRAQASRQLLKAQAAAIGPLVQALIDPRQAAIHGPARAIVREIGSEAVAPLSGLLASGDATVEAASAGLLELLNAGDAVEPLIAVHLSAPSNSAQHAAAARALQTITGRQPSAEEARALLERAVRRHLETSRLPITADEPAREIWQWDTTDRQSLALETSAPDAEIWRAFQLARPLHESNPENPQYRRLYLIAMLELAKLRYGFDRPLPTGPGTAYAGAASQPMDVLDDVLAQALSGDFIPAATAVAQVLGDVGSARLLERSAAHPSPLAAAAAHPDRRLRFAAVDAILKLHPTRSFAGASRVSEALGYFLTTSGYPRVLVAHPRSQVAQHIAGLLAGLGYETDIATNGRDALRLAASSQDYDFLLVHAALEHPSIRDVLKQLRHDPRTARLPIGVIALVDDEAGAAALAGATGRAVPMLPPSDALGTQFYADALLALCGRDRLTSRERSQQAATALDWMVALVKQPKSVFDLRALEPAVKQALTVPALAPKAALVLGELGSSSAQRELSDLAGNMVLPLTMRQAAATAFRHSVHRYGIQLTKDEILRRYDVYNASSRQDRATQDVLASILDTIERKDDKQ